MIYYRFDLEWNGSAPVIKFNHPADDEWYTPLKVFDETESTARLNAFEREYTNHVLFEMNEQFKNERYYFIILLPKNLVKIMILW